MLARFPVTNPPRAAAERVFGHSVVNHFQSSSSIHPDTPTSQKHLELHSTQTTTVSSSTASSSPFQDFHRRAKTMAPIGKKNRCGRSQLRPIGLRFPISSSFCFRRALFLPPRLPLSVSGTMAPIRKKNRSEKSQLRRFRKMEKKVSKLRAEQIRAKESLEKDKAKAEEKAIKLAEERRLLELRKKENACSERCIDLTFDICAAEAQGDFARAELLKHSRSELLAEMNEEIQAFMNAGGSLDD